LFARSFNFSILHSHLVALASPIFASARGFGDKLSRAIKPSAHNSPLPDRVGFRSKFNKHNLRYVFCQLVVADQTQRGRINEIDVPFYEFSKYLLRPLGSVLAE